MMKRLLFATVLVVGGALCGTANAGLVTSLLSSQNAGNDAVQDQSLGYLLDVDSSQGASIGDIGWGLIRVDRINNINVGNRVFVVYAARLESNSSPYMHSAVYDTDDYSLKNILPSSLGNLIDYQQFGKPLAVLLETPAAVTIPGLNFDGNSNTLTPSALKTVISSSNQGAPFANAQLIATFGFGDSQPDFYRLNLIDSYATYDFFVQNLGLSVIQSFVGPTNDWKPLFNDANSSFSLPPHEAALYNGTLTVQKSWQQDGNLNYFLASGVGTYRVNYVPEPASMIGLASLALAGAGLGFVRRRKA